MDKQKVERMLKLFSENKIQDIKSFYTSDAIVTLNGVKLTVDQFLLAVQGVVCGHDTTQNSN